MEDAFAQCEALVREADKDRFLATLFAPQRCRRQLYALYAFNVEITLVRERVHEPMPGELRLQWWRDALAGGAGPARAHPIAAAFIDTVVRARLPVQSAVDLIDARGFDIYDEAMATLADLETYARRTASVIIELAAKILGNGAAPDIADLARHAGIAYAVTGLLRGIALHAARGQLYIPLDVLQRHGVPREDILRAHTTPALRAALAEMREHARRHLAAARSLAGTAPAAILPALLPVALVPLYLDRMERRGYDPFTTAVEVPQWRRQWMLWRAARRGGI